MNLKDWLFKFRIYKGVRIIPPDGLIDISYYYIEKLPDTFETLALMSPYRLSSQDAKVDNQIFSALKREKIVRYHYSLLKNHPMCEWLQKCEGAWKITVDKKEKQVYINFARAVDAVMFRIMTA